MLIIPVQANLQYLAAKAEKVPMSSNNLGIGQFLIFKSGEDWFRGAVIKVKDGKVKMFSLDFGFSSRSFRVTEDNLQPLPGEETKRTKFWASPCSLGEDYTELNPGVKQEGDLLEVSVIAVEKIKYIFRNH